MLVIDEIVIFANSFVQEFSKVELSFVPFLCPPAHHLLVLDFSDFLDELLVLGADDGLAIIDFKWFQVFVNAQLFINLLAFSQAVEVRGRSDIPPSLRNLLFHFLLFMKFLSVCFPHCSLPI
jgi:hypothetical protein